MSATREDLGQAEDGEEAASTRHSTTPARWLAMMVALVVVAVLALGSLADALGMAPQPVTQPTAQGALTQRVGSATVSLTVIMTPAAANQTEALQAQVVDALGAAVVGASVQCALSMPAMGMTLPAVTATAMAQPGRYRCAAQALSSGAWTLHLTLILPSGETDHATFDIVVA